MGKESLDFGRLWSLNAFSVKAVKKNQSVCLDDCSSAGLCENVTFDQCILVIEGKKL